MASEDGRDSQLLTSIINEQIIQHEVIYNP